MLVIRQDNHESSLLGNLRLVRDGRHINGGLGFSFRAVPAIRASRGRGISFRGSFESFSRKTKEGLLSGLLKE